MPEPLRLDVELGAQGVAAGIGEISKASDGLKVSSQKASFAVKAFAHDIANAKDASDVASAALGAFTRILGTSVGATVIAAGAKAVYDAYTEITGAVDKAKKSLEEAYDVTSRGGMAESFADGVTQAKEFDKVADAINKKIKEINDSPLQNLIDAVTQSTDQMRETAKLAEDEAIRRRQSASAAELQYQISIKGATGEQKAVKEVEKALADQLNQIDVLKEGKTAANLVAIAELKKEAIEQQHAMEERQKSEKNLIEVIKERAQTELKAYEAEAKARQDAQKIFENFEAEREKAHTAELKRSAERIDSIKQEIQSLQEKGDAMTKSLQVSGGELATGTAKIGGSARGPGQRKTSFEVGMDRKAKQAEQEAQREFKRQTEQIAKERLEAKGAPTDKAAIQRELGVMQKEGIMQKTLAPIEEYKKQQKELEKNRKALSDNTKELKNSEKAQAELTKQTDKTTASFEDVDHSVNKINKSFDITSDFLGDFGKTAEETTSFLDDSSDSLADFSDETKSSAEGLGDLNSAASDLASNFSKLSELAVEKITTDSIVLN